MKKKVNNDFEMMQKISFLPKIWEVPLNEVQIQCISA